MATYSIQKLSQSTNGKGVLIAATASPGTLIHTAVAGSDWDEIWIYGTCNTGTSKLVTLQWGGTTAPNDLIKKSVSGEDGLLLIVPGLRLQNSLEVRAFCEMANVVTIHGNVNRITA